MYILRIYNYKWRVYAHSVTEINILKLFQEILFLIHNQASYQFEKLSKNHFAWKWNKTEMSLLPTLNSDKTLLHVLRLGPSRTFRFLRHSFYFQTKKLGMLPSVFLLRIWFVKELTYWFYVPKKFNILVAKSKSMSFVLLSV